MAGRLLAPVSCDPGGGKVCQRDASCVSGASGVLLGSLRRLGCLLAAVHFEFCFTVPKGDSSTLSLVAFLTALGLPERGVRPFILSVCAKVVRMVCERSIPSRNCMKELHFHPQNHELGPFLVVKTIETLFSVFHGTVHVVFCLTAMMCVLCSHELVRAPRHVVIDKPSYFPPPPCFCAHRPFLRPVLGIIISTFLDQKWTVVLLCSLSFPPQRTSSFSLNAEFIWFYSFLFWNETYPVRPHYVP